VRHIPPVRPWETAALALEAELWAALYRTDVEVPALARRAAHLIAAYRAAPAGDQGSTTPTASTDPPVLDEASLRALAALESWPATRTMAAESAELEERRHADERATWPSSGTLCG
jgi:hypothetical protein